MRADPADPAGMPGVRARAPGAGRWLKIVLTTLVVTVVVVVGSLSAIAWYFGRDLPDYHKITDYKPPPGRTFVKADALPPVLVHAFLAAEDRHFFSHPGIDIEAIARAMVVDIFRVAEGKRPVGASTITQQVVRHFLLSDKVSVKRKIEEMLLALRIERVLSKDRILELYVNTIYFGCGNWGVAQAAHDYFGEPVGKLTLAQAALIAGLPQSPNDYNPRRFPLLAKERRNQVLGLMAEDGYISAGQERAAKATPVTTAPQPTGKRC